jgi:hypothetical protein
MHAMLPLFAFGLAISVPAAAAEIVPVPAFRSIELRGGGTVVVRPASAQRVVFTHGSSRFTKVSVEPNGKLRIEACRSRCPENYRLEMVVESPRMPDVAISGGGKVTAARGFAAQPQLSVAVRGGGRIDARAVSARKVSAAVSAGGDIGVRPQDMLSAAVNAGGTIRYQGNPKVSNAVNAGGSVQRER